MSERPAARAAIFANGILNPRPGLKERVSERRVICADGGARHALALGLVPEVVIGDLDSFPADRRQDLEARGTRFIVLPRDKDQTDLELALNYAITTGARDILLLGLVGGRLDQTLANLLLLTRPEWGAARLTIIDGPDTAYLLRHGETAVIHGQAGDTVSLIPLSATVVEVTTQGLRWPLRGAVLEFGSTLTISNELVERTARVWIGAGRLLVVHRRNTDHIPQKGGEP